MGFEIVKFGVVFLFYLSATLFEIVNCKEISKRSADCAENEMYVDCGKCGAKTCSDLGFPQPCAGSSKRYCKAGCVCIDGFVKDENGTCIWNKDCPSCGGDPNAESGCGNHCGNSCSDYMEKDKLCLSGCRYNSCKCRKGYVFDDDKGKCVSPEECPPRPENCPKYEVFTECKPVCPPQTCDSIFIEYNCLNSIPCEPGCKCQEGYLRDGNNGTCIAADQCPTSLDPTCPENEEYSDCAPVCPPQTCESIYSLYNCEGAVACQPGCQCVSGYLRDNGTCVPSDNCPPPLNTTCPENEEYTDCAPVCPPQTCESIYSSYNCEDAAPCQPGCQCVSEYLRNNGTCVPSEECPPPLPVCLDNEEYIVNNTRCEESCPVAVESADDVGAAPASRECPASSGCFCQEGFVRDQNFSCVPADQCPTPQVCDGPNEYLNTCYSACATDCKTRFRGDGRVCPAVCLTGCSCESGFLRHDNGTCVPVDECSAPICNDDEVFSQGSPCEKNCDNLNNTCTVCIQIIQDGCFCKENTIRTSADNLTCVAVDNCPAKQCPENEHHDPCPPDCPPETCLAIWTRFACDTPTDCCAPQCRCNDGFYRNSAGLCITTQQCINTRGE